ncbi:hypothetical protein Dimus_029434 [Dionaea muscipula]
MMIISICKSSKRWVWFLLSVMFLLFSWPYFQCLYSINGSSINVTNIFFSANDNHHDPNDPSSSANSTLLSPPFSSQNLNETSHLYHSPDQTSVAHVEGTGDDQLSLLPPSAMETESNGTDQSKTQEKEADSCAGRYIYIHDLPSRFNDDLLKNCHDLSTWMDFCPYVKNHGFGPRVEDSEGVIMNTSWYKTDQFMLSVIFHNRLKSFECLTQNSSLASAIHVPFYAGLEVGSHLFGFNSSVRDAAALDLVRWLREKQEWGVLHGRDHFIVSGRISWDLRRRDIDSIRVDWGSKFLNLPEAKNMTVLTIESSPWVSNEFAIPYPTYFHPHKDDEVLRWQEMVRRQERQYLFTFQGAPRPNMTGSIRSELIYQCLASKRQCKFVNCTDPTMCNDPVHVMRNFKDSVFCLQPNGDSYTRRSTFDSILAGCIPVFFHPGSAYTQYLWHFPKNYTNYSVFIPTDVVKNNTTGIEQVLSRIPKDRVLAMREEVIRLIPRIIYSSSKLRGTEDAFDKAISRTLERINAVRKKIKEGKDPSNNFPENMSWKYYLSGTLGKHEWDSYF